ncbi:MAG: glycosyltransferase [bacterium]
MKNIIFYQPLFIDEATDKDSGSLVRPELIKHAFIEYGYNIIYINGSISDRRKKIISAIKNIKKIEFMYIESTNIPFCLSNHKHWPISFGDFKNILLVKKYMKVGIFYRDAYWRYKNFRSQVGFLKSIILKILYYFELIFLKKYVNIIFVPNIAFSKFLPKIYGNAKYIPLPPGCDKNVKILFEKPKLNCINLLYSGNISNYEYCINGLLKVIQKIDKVKLTINTNKKAFNKYIKYNPLLKVLQMKKIVDVTFSSYNETEKLLKKYQLAIIYNNIDVNIRKIYMPIKLFNYISMGLPIIAERNSGYGCFIEKNKIGWTFSNDQELETILLNLFNNQKYIIYAAERVKKVKNENTWKERVKTIERYLK